MARVFLAMNGKKINTLDDLRVNFNGKQMLDFFRAGRLQKWLEEQQENDLLETVQNFQKENYDDATLLSMLMAAFELDDEQIDTANKIQEQRLSEEKKKKEIAEQEALQKKNSSKAIVTNEDIELFWDDTELGYPECFYEPDAVLISVLKNQFISTTDALYYVADKKITTGTGNTVTDKSLYESKNGTEFTRINDIDNLIPYATIQGIQEINGKLFLSLQTAKMASSSEFPINIIIESNSNRTAWFERKTEDVLSPVWGVTETESGISLLNLYKTTGYRNQAKEYTLRSTADIEYLSYFKGNYIAAGHWYSLAYKHHDTYSFYFSSDRYDFEPVTPPEAACHRSEYLQMQTFESIAFITAYSLPPLFTMPDLPDNQEKKEKKYILPTTKTFYTIDGRTWHLSPIKAHKVFKTGFGFLAYSIEYGTQEETFDYIFKKNRFVKFAERSFLDFKGLDFFHIHHIYVSVDGICWKELPLPSSYLKFILPIGEKFLFLSDGFFNIHTKQNHEKASCFFGEIKPKGNQTDFLKTPDKKIDFIELPSNWLGKGYRKLLVSVGQTIKKGENIFSNKIGLFKKEYFQSPFDCEILYIFQDDLKHAIGFIVKKI